MSLVELMMASGLGVIVMGAIMTMSFYTARSFVSLDNYADMDQESRLALDRMTREIRQAESMDSVSATNIVFNIAPGGPLEYQYLPQAEELRQLKGSEMTLLLSGCKGVKFEVFQRNTMGGTFNQFPNIVTTNQAKVIQVSWTCARDIMGSEENVVNVQSAKVVVRK